MFEKNRVMERNFKLRISHWKTNEKKLSYLLNQDFKEGFHSAFIWIQKVYCNQFELLSKLFIDLNVMNKKVCCWTCRKDDLTMRDFKRIIFSLQLRHSWKDTKRNLNFQHWKLFWLVFLNKNKLLTSLRFLTKQNEKSFSRFSPSKLISFFCSCLQLLLTDDAAKDISV